MCEEKVKMRKLSLAVSRGVTSLKVEGDPPIRLESVSFGVTEDEDVTIQAVEASGEYELGLDSADCLCTACEDNPKREPVSVVMRPSTEFCMGNCKLLIGGKDVTDSIIGMAGGFTVDDLQLQLNVVLEIDELIVEGEATIIKNTSE